MRIANNLKSKSSNRHDVKIIASMNLNGVHHSIVESLDSGWWILVENKVINCNGSSYAGLVPTSQLEMQGMTDSKRTSLFSGIELRLESEIETICPYDEPKLHSHS